MSMAAISAGVADMCRACLAECVLMEATQERQMVVGFRQGFRREFVLICEGGNIFSEEIAWRVLRICEYEVSSQAGRLWFSGEIAVKDCVQGFGIHGAARWTEITIER